ncbi:hypothetical protein AK88_05164 [Plasmodium fragile]|uniref:Tyrosine specific protein phosphatases domain-containing protein n=1 Tax=Plasmodium fragile TaxID=5857 RepID=A0A0D9QDS8_PLAFR|nr:uncharacterized protein AK88_05164 [Plasmodium fragile]KJP85205.1 hypothetical protein AK88_05164 [Plasmodium fragile]
MVGDEGVSGFRGVSGINRVNAARRGGNNEDEEEEEERKRRSLSPHTKDDTTHSEEDKQDEGGPSAAVSTSKRTIQLSIRGIKVDKLNLRSFRRKREEQKKKHDGEDGREDGDGADGEDILAASSSTCTELLDGRLLLSGYEFASDCENLKKKKITHIVNVGGEECPNKFEDTFSYKTYYVKDDLQEDMLYTLLDATHFIKITLSSDEGNIILVHCNKGISRSVIVVVFFLMTHLELSFGDAFDLVKRRRPLSNPNLSFVSQVLRLFGLRKRLRSGAKDRADLMHATTTVAHPPGEATLIFRIDGAGKALTLTNLMSLSSDEDACTKSNNPRTKLTQIDQRFNYVLTKDFREFYLLLLDPIFEDVCTPLLERFAQICGAFFHGGRADSTQTIVRSDVAHLMQQLQLDIQLFSCLPSNDGTYLKLQHALQDARQGGKTTR